MLKTIINSAITQVFSPTIITMITANSPAHQQMIEWRRWLHRYPELALQEHKTSDYVAEQLQNMGLTVHHGLAGTGIVATLKGQHPSQQAIALRADMDALPIQELNQFEHASQHQGKMHACGHDGHTAMLLGAAQYLSQHPSFAGTVYFIFQPAEEEKAGAKIMLDQGLFEQFPCDAVYGMHNWPALPAGQFAVHQRECMAGSQRVNINIHGKSGHAAMPDQAIDPIVISAQIITAAQSIVSRNTSPFESIVLSLTMIEGGTARNVIPESVRISGLIRYYQTDACNTAMQRLSQLVKQISESMGGHGDIEFEAGYPPTLNTPSHADHCAEIAKQLVGRDKVQRNHPPSMGAEDFAYLLQAKAGAYIWLGTGGSDHEHGLLASGLGTCMLHNAHYDFNDEMLALGANYWITLAKETLS